MKLTVFQSDKGDCLLVTTSSGHNMLVDGGMHTSYTAHVAPTLGNLRKQGKILDVAYVSHIDDDHISGVLQMLDDLVAWRVFEHKKKTNNPKAKQPQCERPPDINSIWHNGFRDQIGKNAGEIEDTLSASAGILAASESQSLKELASVRGDLATSVRQALQLSNRISADQLKIKLNPEFNGKLMCVKNGQPPLKLGSATLTLIGPFAADVSNLRDEWNTWLSENKDAVMQIRRRARSDQGELRTSAHDALSGSMLNEADTLGTRLLSSTTFPADDLVAKTKVLGQRAKVSTPNLASLMFLLEEKGKTVLLTGDGHGDDIVKGLMQHGKLTAGQPFRVNVLKVQHHGSEHNISQSFVEQIVADDYIFCGNGFSANPDLDVLKMLISSRMKVQGSFRLWFNCNAQSVKNPGWAKHMREVEKLTKQLVGKDDKKARASFLKESSFSITP